MSSSSISCRKAHHFGGTWSSSCTTQSAKDYTSVAAASNCLLEFVSLPINPGALKRWLNHYSFAWAVNDPINAAPSMPLCADFLQVTRDGPAQPSDVLCPSDVVHSLCLVPLPSLILCAPSSSCSPHTPSGAYVGPLPPARVHSAARGRLQGYLLSKHPLEGRCSH